MSGPKEVTETYEKTFTVCPRCECRFTDYREIPIEDDGFTLAAVPSLPDGSGACYEIDQSDGVLWAYFHSPSTIEDDQNVRLLDVKEVIRELQEEHDGDPGAPEERVTERARDSGYPPERTRFEIQKLRDKGEIYSPDQEHVRLV